MRSGLILFVHGLGGHPLKTWGRFPELIRNDPAFQRFELGYYSFPTSLFRFPWSPRYPRIHGLAKSLRTEIENRFKERDEVTLVCHSLGGLIARRYLVDEVRKKRPLRVTRLLLYAVPNSGAGLANITHHIAWRHGQLSQLARKSDFLDLLNEDWADYELSEKVRVKYVVALQDNVVDQRSAQAFPGNPDVEVVDDRGHVDLVKPKSEHDIAYLIFRNFMNVAGEPRSGDSVTRVTVTKFRSAGGGHQNEIVANGVTDRLIKNLTNLDGVDPVPRVAMMRRGERPPTEIAEEFNADYLVEGSFERLPGSHQCTVFASLTERDHGQLRSLWSDEYQRPWRDVQEVLVEVATKVARHIKHTVSLKELRLLENAPIRPTAAWEAFMEGSWAVEEFNNGHKNRAFRKAEDSLEKALALDRNYPEALEQLGFLYIVAWEARGGEDLLSKSQEVWEELLESDPENAFALAELGLIEYVRGDSGGKALNLARRAVQSNPELTFAHNVIALIYLYLGYYESQVHVTREEIFRRDPYYIYPYTNTALSLQLMARYGEALEVALEARRVDRCAMVSILLEGAQHYHRGAPREAARIWQEGKRVCKHRSDRSVLDTALGWTLVAAEDLQGAREKTRRYRDEQWISGGYGPYFISLCSLAGEADLALELLGNPTTYARSYRFLVSDKTLRPLTAEPRFKQLLEERYEQWRRDLRELGPLLPAMPSAVPDPVQFLTR